MDKKKQSKINHGQLYKIALWTAVIVFGFATFLTIGAILFDGFTSFTSRLLFVMWQVFWFGFLAVLFANFYEKNSPKMSRCIAVAAVIGCALLLVIGIFQAMFPEPITYNTYTNCHFQNCLTARPGVYVVLEKIQYIVTIFVYMSVLVECHLKTTSDIRAVILARDMTAGAMMVVMLILDIMILVDYDDVGGIMARFIVAMIILIVTGVITTQILAAIYKKDTKSASVVTPNNQTATSQPATIEPETVVPSSQADAETSKDQGEAIVKKIQVATGRSHEECLVIMNVLKNGILLDKQTEGDFVKGLVGGLGIPEKVAKEVYSQCATVLMVEFLKRG